VEKKIDRHRTGVVLGHHKSASSEQINIMQHLLTLPQLLDMIKNLSPNLPKELLQSMKQELKEQLFPLTTDADGNLSQRSLAGHISHCFNLQGPNFTIDEADASSLVALNTGIYELQSNTCDLVLVGGVHADMNIFTLKLFSLLGILATHGDSIPFDKNAHGCVLGEGLGMVVIKRLKDAERDKNRIYAVVKSIGIANDARQHGASDPADKDGRIYAMERAFEQTDITPETITLFEAHGSAVSSSDNAEIQAMVKFFWKSVRQTAALCSWLSQINDRPLPACFRNSEPHQNISCSLQ